MNPSNPYINDILNQPAALQAALDLYPAEALAPLADRLQAGEFRRVLLTGMGSSLNAAYPAWLTLAGLPTTAVFVNAAELLHYGRRMIDGHTLLWMNSQSGESVEVVRLLEELQGRRPAFLVSMSNHPESSLARAADLPVDIRAGAEATVSTKTYINMLAVLLLASTQLTGGDWQHLLDEMQQAAEGLNNYLAHLEEQITRLDDILGSLDQLMILGRGASMAAVWNGSLIQKEAAKCAVEGMNAADFRHGPLELAGERLAVLMLAGTRQTADLNRGLALEVLERGGRAFWLDFQPDPEIPTLLLPQAPESTRPLVEILPLQMLTILLARRKGIEAGAFRHVGKITTRE